MRSRSRGSRRATTTAAPPPNPLDLEIAPLPPARRPCCWRPPVALPRFPSHGLRRERRSRGRDHGREGLRDVRSPGCRSPGGPPYLHSDGDACDGYSTCPVHVTGALRMGAWQHCLPWPGRLGHMACPRHAIQACGWLSWEARRHEHAFGATQHGHGERPGGRDESCVVPVAVQACSREDLAGPKHR